MPIPSHPVLFIKPRAALCGPAPQKVIVPKLCQDGTSDYEAELTIVISKSGKEYVNSERSFPSFTTIH